MIKDSIKTLIVLFLFILLIGVGVTIYNICLSNNESKEKGDRISEDEVSDILDFVHNSPQFFKLGMRNFKLSSQQILEVALENLGEDDYVSFKVYPVKIVCEVTNVISFTSNSICNVQAFSKETLDNFALSYFGEGIEVEMIDFENDKFVCKTDKKNLYCMKKNIRENVLSYFSFKEAYKNKDSILIYEYYLPISTTNEDVCTKYFTKEYCLSPNLDNNPYVVEEKLIENGTLYKYRIKEKDENFIVEEIAIAN